MDPLTDAAITALHFSASHDPLSQREQMFQYHDTSISEVPNFPLPTDSQNRSHMSNQDFLLGVVLPLGLQTDYFDFPWELGPDKDGGHIAAFPEHSKRGFAQMQTVFPTPDGYG
jgi:hypothetical protein